MVMLLNLFIFKVIFSFLKRKKYAAMNVASREGVEGPGMCPSIFYSAGRT
jgi:hypothetical protein